MMSKLIDDFIDKSPVDLRSIGEIELKTQFKTLLGNTQYNSITKTLPDEIYKEFIRMNNLNKYSQGINTYDFTEALMDEAVNLTPMAQDPDEMRLQLELDDYDDNGEIKSFAAWDNATDAYHAGDAKAWKDNLIQMERDPAQVNVHGSQPQYTASSLSKEDELANEEEMVKKYQIQRAKRIAKQNAETDLFNFDFDELEA